MMETIGKLFRHSREVVIMVQEKEAASVLEEKVMGLSVLEKQVGVISIMDLEKNLARLALEVNGEVMMGIIMIQVENIFAEEVEVFTEEVEVFVEEIEDFTEKMEVFVEDKF